MMNFIREALENAIENFYIVPAAVNNYVNTFSPDRRYKLKWLASDCYGKGCSSGIISYRGCEYYFSLSGTALTVEYR